MATFNSLINIGYINYTDLIRLLKVALFFFRFHFPIIFNLPMCTLWRDSVYAATPLVTLSDDDVTIIFHCIMYT
jgi:hypothetical protein